MKNEGLASRTVARPGLRRGASLWLLLATAMQVTALPGLALAAGASVKAEAPQLAVTPSAPVTSVPPEYDLPLAEKSGKATLILAGGCYWGMQAVFQHVKGVSNVTAGYAGGLKSTANYANVIGGGTGHAESVLIEYDPAQLTIGTLLQIYFFVAHDPTQLNRQGPDVGTQYRSTIFTDNVDEKRVAVAYMNQIDALKLLPHPIATKMRPLFPFHRAEGSQQNFVQNHPKQRYVLVNDLPKVARLKEAFPKLWREQPLRYEPEENKRSKLLPPPTLTQ
ncbi:peptide-methionine (S)-S-oxide reductase MsrA [Nevskia sp.]|uniref:peptide-methionine (S)-S-oxide reductase MsrA n=1 Tax=Nevskia sp. TaxID=1929292 RepID=UPI0025E4477A|nr:peptide-methionine (S)-S-oxide reductase MsrA [Nevskia sp.]